MIKHIGIGRVSCDVSAPLIVDLDDHVTAREIAPDRSVMLSMSLRVRRIIGLGTPWRRASTNGTIPLAR